MEHMDNMENRLTVVLYESLKTQLDDEYTDYKRKKIQELDKELERKRNEIVQDILNSITILSSNEPFGINFTIKIENKIVKK